MKIKWWHITLFVVIVLAVAAILHPTRLRTGWMLHESQRPEEAIQHFLEVLKDNPNNYRAIDYLAIGYEKIGNVEKANEYFKKLLELRPNDKHYKEVARFYAWTKQKSRLKETYENWFQYKKDNNKTFKNKEGKQLLNDLYAYRLLYQEYDKAAELLEFKKTIFPREGKGLDTDLITLYERSGNLEATVRHLERMLGTISTNKYALEKYLQLAEIADKVPQAEKFLIRNIEHHPKDKAHWMRLINFEIYLDRFDVANEWFVKWLNTFPENMKLKNQYVDWLIGNEKPKLAMKYLEKLQEMGIANKKHDEKLVRLYEWNNERGKLIPIYFSRFRKNPSDRKNNRNLIWSLSEEKRYEEQKRILHQLVTLHPGDKEYTMMLVDIYGKEENAKAALAALEEIALKTDDPTILKMLGQRYYWNGNYSKANEIFSSLIKKTPNDVELYKYLGDTLANSRPKKAIKYFQEYSVRHPGDYYPYYRMGEIYRGLGEISKSKEELEKALTLMHSDLLIKMRKARIYCLLGKTELCKDTFNNLIANNPGNVELAALYINTLLDVNNYNDGLKLAKEYSANYPDNTDFERTLARAYMAKSQYANAEPIMTSLIDQNPDDTSMQIDYAYLLLDQGNWTEAKKIFKKLEKEYPNNKEIEKGLDLIFERYRPRIIGGMGSTFIGSERRFGPYLRYIHPINSQWAFEADYLLERNTTTLPTLNLPYKSFTNELALMARYKPIPTLTLGAGLISQLVDTAYSPAPIIQIDWNDPQFGRLLATFSYNRILKDPVSGLYYDTHKDTASLTYEKTFYDTFSLYTRYSSIWYRLDRQKTGTGGGNQFGREDVAEFAGQFIVLKKPELRLGYGFYFSDLHIENNYLNLIPLIEKSKRHNILYGFAHDWNKWLSTDVGGFIGHDSERNLSISNLDLYGFNATAKVKASKRLEFLGHYEYSSEDLFNTTGQYQSFFVEFLYRF